MSSIMQILRRIGGTKSTPTSGSAGQIAAWKAGTGPNDATALFFHDGVQWVELLDTAGRKVTQPVVSSETAPATPFAGEFWFKPSTKALSVWDGAAWAGVAVKNATNTFTQSQVIDVTDNTSPALRVTQRGTGEALRVEDEANPDTTPFVVGADGRLGVGHTSTYDGRVLAWKTDPAEVAFMAGGLFGSPGMPDYSFAGQNSGAGPNLGTGMYLPSANVLGFSTLGKQRIKIESDGRVIAGDGPTAADGRFQVYDAFDGDHVLGSFRNISNVSGATATSIDLVADQSSSRITNVRDGALGNSSYLVFKTSDTGVLAQKLHIAPQGTMRNPAAYAVVGAGSNMIVTSSGDFVRASSSLKYKRNVEALDPVLTDRAVSQLRPVWYRTKKVVGDDREDWSHIGLIAEEVAKIEPRLVNYKTTEVSFDDSGNQVVSNLETPVPEDVDYARLSVLLLDYVQRLEKRVAVLEARP